jgi:hypothetical protein
MNGDTLALMRRSYPDIVDDLLTAVVGGVVNEPVPFDVKQLRYALSQPAAAVRSVKGAIDDGDGQPSETLHVFQPTIDYVFSASDSSIVWQPKGAQPFDETTFYVDYFRVDAQSPLSDINIGSVTRTVVEAIGREIATVYQEVYNAYLAGFVDTAQGASLDHVVAILDVQRRGAEYAIGLATFLRDPAISGNVTIPAGTQLATAKRIVFETAQLRTLQQGQQRMDVPISATGDAKGPLGVVPAGSIITLDPPIAGIASVTNFEPTTLGAAPETDDALRLRAKAVLQGSGNATLAALMRTVLDERSKVLDLRDPNGPPGKASPPGTVRLLVSTEPTRFAAVNASIQQTRAAGVLATVSARYVYVTPRLSLTLSAALTPAGKLKLVGQVIDALQAYFDALQPGGAASGADMLEAISTLPEVKSAKPRFLDVLAARANIDDPGSEPIVESLLDAIDAAPSTDRAAQALAIRNVLDEDVEQQIGETRVADRSVLVGAAGRASDDEIEAGTFTIQPPPPVDGDPWSLALSMQTADVQLAGA